MSKSRTAEQREFETRESQIVKYLKMGYEDKLYIDPETIPKEVDYYWVRDSLLGTPDPNRLASLRKKGWTPVPAHRHPELVQESLGSRPSLEGYIHVDGLILCERPKKYGMIEKRATEEKNIKSMSAVPGQDHFMDDPSMPMRIITNQSSYGAASFGE